MEYVGVDSLGREDPGSAGVRPSGLRGGGGPMRERWEYCGVVEWYGQRYHLWAGPGKRRWVAQWDLYRLRTLGAGAL